MRARGLRVRIGILVGAVCVAGLCPAARKGDSRDKWQQPDRVVSDLGLRHGSVIADIGCGRGYFTFRLGEAVGQEGKVYATEINAKVLKSVADRVKRDKLTNIETVLSEPTKTKLKPQVLDAALLVNVLHHVPKGIRPDLVKDIVRALKPGGYLFIVDWRLKAKVRWDRGRRIPRDDLVKLGTDAGLTLDAEFYYLEHQVFLRLRKPTKGK